MAATVTSWKPGQSGNRKGRPAGALAKRTQELRAKAKELGVDPIDVMIQTMQELVAEARKPRRSLVKRFDFLERACAIAKDAAPYLHPKLQSVELTGNDDHPVRIAGEARDRALGAILGLAATIGTRDSSKEPPRVVN
jgi:Family of unknown function (DUF5681)